MHKKCKLFCNTGIKTEGSPERGFFCRSRLFPHLERQKEILRANLFRVIQIMIKNQNSFRENRGLRDGGGRRKTPTKTSCAKRRKTVEQSEKNNETESRKSDFPRKTRKLYQETGEYLFVEPEKTEEKYPIPAAFAAYARYMEIKLGQEKYREEL